MPKIFLAVLDKNRQEIFLRLKAFKNCGYLAGGTALAIQVQHRRSYDFDIFVGDPVKETFRRKIIDFFSPEKFYLDNREQLSFEVGNHTGVTFLHYPYPRNHPLIPADGLSLADSRDIATDKAFTLGRRATWRDYVDLYFLFKKEIISLGNLIESAEKKFQKEFNRALFLEQLVYPCTSPAKAGRIRGFGPLIKRLRRPSESPHFQDIVIAPIEFLGVSVPEETIKAFLKASVRDYLRRRKLFVTDGEVERRLGDYQNFGGGGVGVGGGV